MADETFDQIKAALKEARNQTPGDPAQVRILLDAVDSLLVVVIAQNRVLNMVYDGAFRRGDPNA